MLMSDGVRVLPTPESVSISKISPICVKNITVYVRAHALYCYKDKRTHTSHTRPTPTPPEGRGDRSPSRTEEVAELSCLPSLREGLGVGFGGGLSVGSVG